MAKSPAEYSAPAPDRLVCMGTLPTTNVDDAIKLYHEALAERPNFPEALLNLGHALKSKGSVEEARNYWRQALEHKPELATGYFGQ